MTPEILKREVSDIFDNFTGIRIIFVVKIEDSYSLKLSKIEAGALPKIVEGFKRKIEEDMIENDDLTIPLYQILMIERMLYLNLIMRNNLKNLDLLKVLQPSPLTRRIFMI